MDFKAIRASQLADLYVLPGEGRGGEGGRVTQYPPTGCAAGGGDCLRCRLDDCQWDETSLSRSRCNRDGDKHFVEADRNWDRRTIGNGD
jgi:hypothetical protein